MTTSTSGREKEDIWETSVDEVMRTFHGALVSLLPYLRAVRIPIGVHVGTDSWDEIMETLYRQMVEETLRYGLPLDQAADFSLPTYETAYTPDSHMSFIQARENRGNALFAFHSFCVDGSKEASFKGYLSNSNSLLLSSELNTLPLDQYTFRLRFPSGFENFEEYNELRVML